MALLRAARDWGKGWTSRVGRLLIPRKASAAAKDHRGEHILVWACGQAVLLLRPERSLRFV